MTHQEATLRIHSILDGLISRDLVSRYGRTSFGDIAKNDFGFRNGELFPEPEPDLPDYYRVIWRPNDETLQPLDISSLSVEEAVEQIGRYAHSTYARARRHFEAIVAAASSAGKRPIPEKFADSVLIGDAGLRIRERIVRGGQPPEYRIHLIPRLIVQQIPLGEAADEYREYDVSDKAASEVIKELLVCR